MHTSLTQKCQIIYADGIRKGKENNCDCCYMISKDKAYMYNTIHGCHLILNIRRYFIHLRVCHNVSLFEDACQNILDLDKTIRFAGIANMRRTIVSAKYRSGLVPLLTQEETVESIEHSVLRMSTRKIIESKLGKTIYSITLYEKVKRAVIPIGEEGDFILMVSFDNEADYDSIIRNKIMPLISHHQI